MVTNQQSSSGEFAGEVCAITYCSQSSKSINAPENSLSDAIALHQALSEVINPCLMLPCFCVMAWTRITNILLKYYAALILSFS